MFLVVIKLVVVVVAVEPTGLMYVTHKGGSGWKPRLDYGCCGDQGELFYHGFNMRGVWRVVFFLFNLFIYLFILFYILFNLIYLI